MLESSTRPYLNLWLVFVRASGGGGHAPAVTLSGSSTGHSGETAAQVEGPSGEGEGLHSGHRCARGGFLRNRLRCICAQNDGDVRDRKRDDVMTRLPSCTAVQYGKERAERETR